MSDRVGRCANCEYFKIVNEPGLYSSCFVSRCMLVPQKRSIGKRIDAQYYTYEEEIPERLSKINGYAKKHVSPYWCPKDVKA